MAVMADGGWYPDPSGAAGRFRYWDGASWSDTTTTDPLHAKPPIGGGGTQPSKNGNNGWIVALVVLAVITAIVTVVVLCGTGGSTLSNGATEDTNSSTPTVSAWDETSTPTTPPPPINSGGEMVACPLTNATGNTPQVAGKLTADTLSVSLISGWTVDTMWLDSVYDTHAQVDDVYPGWMSNIAVGLLSQADGFVNISTSAQQMMQCFASSGYYDQFTGRKDLIAGEQIDISGHPAWHIQSEIFVSGQKVPGDVTDIIVVDLGPDKDHLGIFFSSCSIGDTARCKLVQGAISTLAVNG